MTQNLFPRVQSHAHYPIPVVRLANNTPNNGEAKKVLEYWDIYVKRQAERRLSVSFDEFVERYGYESVATY